MMIECNEIVLAVCIFVSINFCVNQAYILYILSSCPLYKKQLIIQNPIALTLSLLKYIFQVDKTILN